MQQEYCRVSDSAHLEAFAVSSSPQELVPAPPERDWMDINRHAYRCLPLTIANAYGWQVLMPCDVTVEWTGGPGLPDVRIIKCDRPHQAVSNFATGIVTFDVGYIFRTPPGYHLLLSGPTNFFKDGAAPMTGVVESDWLPYTFTMNYKFTRPGRVTWSAGEPYVQVCVIRANLQEGVQPIIRNIGDNQQLSAQLAAWTARRTNMRQRLEQGDPEARKTPWDRDYFVGRYADGQKADSPHVNKLRLKNPVDHRGWPA
jgi:hypothetical protein